MPPNIPDPFEPPVPEDEPSDDLIMGKKSQQLSYQQIEEVVNHHDPMGLLGMGAPGDEYKPEIEVILERRNQCNMRLDPAEIRVIFEYWFYPGCITKETASSISSELQALFMGK